MDLKNGNIVIRDLMKNPGARRILQREFPGVVHSPMFQLAQGMTLSQVLGRVRGSVRPEVVRRVLTELEGL